MSLQLVSLVATLEIERLSKEALSELKDPPVAETIRFLFKFVFTLALAVAAFFLVVRMSRPGATLTARRSGLYGSRRPCSRLRSVSNSSFRQ